MAEGREPANEPNLEGDLQATLDTGVAHPARVYDYWLGGKDHFAVDREAAEQVIAANPAVLPGVRANRAFLGRAVRYLAGEAGIRQFLDLGTGLHLEFHHSRYLPRDRRSASQGGRPLSRMRCAAASMS